MKILQLSPKVEVRLPEDWALYRKEAHADKKKIDIKELGDIKEPLYTSISLLSDSSFTLLNDENKLIPGAEDLLRAFKEKLGFEKIIVASGGGWRMLDEVKKALKEPTIVNNYSPVYGSKSSYAAESGVPFVLEDSSKAQKENKFLIEHEESPRRQVWWIQVPDLDEYNPEIIDEITKAVSEVSEELKKL